MDTSIKNLGHIPPHGATSSLIFFWTPYEQNFLSFMLTWCNAVIFWTICAHGFLAIKLQQKTTWCIVRRLFIFWTPYEQKFIYFYAHMVIRHVISSRNTFFCNRIRKFYMKLFESKFFFSLTGEHYVHNYYKNYFIYSYKINIKII